MGPDSRVMAFNLAVEPEQKPEKGGEPETEQELHRRIDGEGIGVKHVVALLKRMEPKRFRRRFVPGAGMFAGKRPDQAACASSSCLLSSAGLLSSRASIVRFSPALMSILRGF